jgi:hypothetical protein
LQYRTPVEALEREKELYSVGAADYAKADEAGRNRLLVERVENILASTTSQFIETHRSARGAPTGETSSIMGVDSAINTNLPLL